MPLYFVSYDLRKQRDYQKLYEALANLNATKILLSDWCFTHNNTSCVQIRDHLRQFIDNDDALFVTKVTDWASIGTLATPPKSF